jgi:heme/copper-type cytochrome/quinol oxidase subunit 2
MLALNTLSVVFFTRILFTEQYKYFIVVVCFVLPIAIYFFPVAAVMRKGLFDLKVMADQSSFQHNFDRIYFIVLLFLLIIAVIGSYIMVWYKFKKNLKVNVKPGKNVDIKAVGLKFIWAYSISILLCNIPLLINELFELTLWLPESLGLFFLYVLNLFNPLRGYFHALAVLIIYVSRVPNRDLSIKIILCRALLFEYRIDEMPEDNRENPGAVITIDSLNWNVSSMRYSSDNRSADPKPLPLVRRNSINWNISSMRYNSDNRS